MIARRGKAVGRGGTSRPAALGRSIDARFDPSVPLKLEELLPDSLTRQLQNLRELRDRRAALLFERAEDRAAAVGQLMNGEDGGLL